MLTNKHINILFNASYVYLSMSSWFARSEIALPGFAAYFRKATNGEREHGIKLMEYLTKRGGKVVFQNIEKPTSMEWGTPLQAMEAALKLEKSLKKSLLALHTAAGKEGDANLRYFLESNYLGMSVECIKETEDLITKIKRAGDGLGTHILDKELAARWLAAQRLIL